MNNYYRPTRGEEIGTWNVFPKDRAAAVRHDVEWNDLPDEIRAYLTDYFEKKS